jgi:hypothetical protein
MDFDQYHEPPNEPPASTRTFAQLCASRSRTTTNPAAPSPMIEAARWESAA